MLELAENVWKSTRLRNGEKDRSAAPQLVDGLVGSRAAAALVRVPGVGHDVRVELDGDFIDGAIRAPMMAESDGSAFVVWKSRLVGVGRNDRGVGEAEACEQAARDTHGGGWFALCDQV